MVRWEVGVRNPYSGEALREIDCLGARSWGRARSLATTILECWPHLITSVRTKRDTDAPPSGEGS